MKLDPQSRTELTRYTMAAKKIIYNAERMKHFMTMLGSPEGAVSAVQTVLSILQQKKPVPPGILPMLAVNCYLAMVDIAQASTRHPPDADVMKAVISKIMDTVKPQQAQPPQEPQPPQQPQGLMASMQGAPA